MSGQSNTLRKTSAELGETTSQQTLNSQEPRENVLVPFENPAPQKTSGYVATVTYNQKGVRYWPVLISTQPNPYANWTVKKDSPSL